MNKAPFKLMYVDDEENDRFLMQRAVTAFGDGVALSMFSDGAEAVAHLETVRNAGDVPDLILTDLKMPRISGRELIEWMRRSDMHCVPAVVISSTQLTADVLACYRSGANAFVCKPIDHRDLCKFVETLVTFWHRFSITPGALNLAPQTTCEPERKAA